LPFFRPYSGTTLKKWNESLIPEGRNFFLETEKVKANPAFPIDSPAQRRIGQAIPTPLD